jgi:tetratricopeptide (TPR) repeat protein
MQLKRSSFGVGGALLSKCFSIPAHFSKSVMFLLITMVGLSCHRQSAVAPTSNNATAQSANASDTSSAAASDTPSSDPVMHPALGPADPSPEKPTRAVSEADVNKRRQELQRDPKNIAVRIRLAALLSVKGEDSEAEDVLRAALQQGQQTAEIYHALGLIYVRNKLWLPAVQAFTLETSLHPKDYQAHLQLAAAYAYLSRVDDAKREFEAAQAIDPSAADPYMGLAYLNNSSERYPYAVQYLNEYIKRSRQPGPGYGLLSRIYLNMQLYDQAVTAGKTATSLKSDDAGIWYTLGQAYSYRPGDQNLSEAAIAFEHAVQITPRWPNAHFELGHVYARQNRVQDAITQYRQAIQGDPVRGKYYYQLGQLLMKHGETQDGKKELEKAKVLIALNQREDQLQQKIAAAPSDPRNLFELAQLYKKMGSYSQAESWLQNILTIAPQYPHAREELSEVRRLLKKQAH